VADIFISYSKKDEADARLLAAFLEAHGYSVWWDANLQGADKYRAIIPAELSNARAVVVIWTKNSVGSEWVQSEAGRAHNDRKLIPVRSGGVEYKDIPPPFEQLHTLALNNREQILAAVAGQLAKPAEPAPLWKKLRYELWVWLGVLGGAITLVGTVEGIFKLSNFFRWLLTNWGALLKYIWQALSFFKFEVTETDAEFLTISLLMISAVFYSSFRQPIKKPAHKSARFLFPALFLIGVILFGGINSIGEKQSARYQQALNTRIETMFANDPECVSAMKDFDFPSGLSKSADRCLEKSGLGPSEREEFRRNELRLREKESENDILLPWSRTLADIILGNLHLPSLFESDWEFFFLLIGLALFPIYLPFLLYWVASFIFPLKLQAPVLSRRLWRTLMVFGGIIVMNYVAVGMELGRDWLKTIPDLN
jgi:hypothetical protein